MLKKLLAIVAASVMMLSCFGGVASAATSGTIVDEFTASGGVFEKSANMKFQDASAFKLSAENYVMRADSASGDASVVYQVEGYIDSFQVNAYNMWISGTDSTSQNDRWAEDLVFEGSNDGTNYYPIAVTFTDGAEFTSLRKAKPRNADSGNITEKYSYLKISYPDAMKNDWINSWYIFIDKVTINYTIPDYTWGELVAKEEASNDTTNWVTKWDLDTTDSRKRTFMNNYDTTTEANSGMWRLYNNGAESDTYIRLSSAYSYGFPLIDGHNDIFRITSHNPINNVETNVAGYTFYSVTEKLMPRMMFIDAASGSDSNPTSKKEAMTLTYEFDFKTLHNFINTEFTIGTGFRSSDTNKAICALYVDDEGFVYSTSSNFDGSNGEKIAELKLDTTYKMGIVIELTPTQTANTYNYEISVYIDGVKKFNGLGSDEVTSVKPGYYGMELEPHPWTVSEFDFANSALKELDSVYTSKDTSFTNNSGDTKLSSSVKYEYTIIDTDTIISSYNVYAYNKYAQDAPSIADNSKEFHISSNVRNNTNYVTVAADAGTATAAKAILATYNGDKLVNVKSADLTLSADAITETDIELTNAGATKKTLFIFDSLGNLKPLAADTELN